MNLDPDLAAVLGAAVFAGCARARGRLASPPELERSCVDCGRRIVAGIRSCDCDALTYDGRDGPLRPTRRDLAVFAGWLLAAGVYIGIGLYTVDFLLSFWVGGRVRRSSPAGSCRLVREDECS